MAKAEDFYSRSGSRMVKVKNIYSKNEKMPTLLYLNSIGTLFKQLSKHVGFFRGPYFLIKAATFGNMFHRPKWDPRLFQYKNKKEKKHFKEKFQEMVIIIILYNYLKKKYGKKKADEITVNLAFPYSLPILNNRLRSYRNIKTTDEILDLLGGFLGDGLGFEYDVYVAEDDSEGAFRFKKCVYVMILKAYGMQAFAGHCCLADHVIFDSIFKNLIFSRKHAIGVGDDYCDHTFIINTKKKFKKLDEDFNDADKAGFKGRERIHKWVKGYKKTGKFG
jgi:hypothetical protein